MIAIQAKHRRPDDRATALTNGAGIITRNAADFAGLERLVRIIPA
ncbi:MAG: hypothetical protein OZ935_09225 [Pseudomonadota bacterium]|nr:hypothetical protein [Pseudomonadota bacterium]